LLDLIGWSPEGPTPERESGTAYTFPVPLSTVFRYAGSWRAVLHEHCSCSDLSGLRLDLTVYPCSVLGFAATSRQ
jgi:hypothetical protein